MLTILLLLLACTPEPGDSDSVEPTTTTPSGPDTLAVPPPTVIEEMPARLVAIGDVHGDFKAARDVLQLVGAIDEDDHWIGGDLVVVQTGDQLDREDGEEKILELFEALTVEAYEAGGAFYSLLGNHEIMNVEQDFRYVTPGGFEDFADTEHDPTDPFYEGLAPEEMGRAAAFRPGGEWATTLAGHNVLMVIGDTAFVHGGVLPDHIDFGLEKINNRTQAWMRGDDEVEPPILKGDDAPIWTRIYSDTEAEPDCDTLADAIAALGVTRMVVGHTIHPQPNAACDGQVWRIDVGMSAYYGGVPMGIEIVDGAVTVLE